MNVTCKIRNQANKIVAPYCRSIYPIELQKMYAELEAIGVTTGMVTNRVEIGHGAWRGDCEWYLNGEIIENSHYVYSVYECYHSEKNEYNIRFT